MKALFSFSSSFFLIMLLMGVQVSTSSCKKETVYIHDTTHTTVTIHDTVVHTDTVPPIPLTNTEMLVAHKWEVEEVYQTKPGSGSQATHYIRGGENTTGYNHDLQTFTFKTNGTGTYTDDLGVLYNTTWHFSNPEETEISFTGTHGASTITFKWVLVSISEDQILQTSAASGVLITVRLVPMP